MPNSRSCQLEITAGAVILDTSEVVADGTAQEVLDNSEWRQEYHAI
ncbi:hypothetical protein [Roseibium sediminis]|nr:hypothetical protein [Roseibium sediminis]